MLVVDSVIPGGPADGLLEPGDVLVRIQGQVIVHFLPMEALLDDHVGQHVSVEIERGGDLLVRNIQVSLNGLVAPAFSHSSGPMTRHRRFWLSSKKHQSDQREDVCGCLCRCKTCMRRPPALSWRWLEASCMA